MAGSARQVSMFSVITDTLNSSCDSDSFEHYSNRLVRHLLETGLQLRVLRTVFDCPHSTPEDIRAASDAVGGVLEDLDTLIHDTGLAISRKQSS